jgi:hypothetical protein
LLLAGKNNLSYTQYAKEGKILTPGIWREPLLILAEDAGMAGGKREPEGAGLHIWHEVCIPKIIRYSTRGDKRQAAKHVSL